MKSDGTYLCVTCGDEVELICYCGEEPDGPSHSLVGYTHDFVNSCKCSCALYSSNPGGLMQHRILREVSRLGSAEVSAWRDIHDIEEDEPLDIDWSRLHLWTPDHRVAVSSAISAWCLKQTSPSTAIRTIANASRELGTWVACSIAQPLVASRNLRDSSPRLAIHRVQACIRGDMPAFMCYDGLSLDWEANVVARGNGDVELQRILLAASLAVQSGGFVDPSGAASMASASIQVVQQLSAEADLPSLLEKIAAQIPEGIDMVALGQHRTNKDKVQL